MTAGHLHNLIETARAPHAVAIAETRLEVAVRLLLRDLAPLLHAAGYGQQP